MGSHEIQESASWLHLVQNLHIPQQCLLREVRGKAAMQGQEIAGKQTYKHATC